MMLFILGGCVLGAVQLLAGIAIGMWLRRADTAEARRGRQDLIQASLIAKRLQALADEMSSSVGEHRSQLDEASQLLTSDNAQSEEALAALVVDVIGDIVRANQNLQSKLETAEHRLQEQAVEIETHICRSLTDPLTGLPNRREFNDRLEERMAAWNRRAEVFSLVLLDVDYFKRLNDEYGHLTGDKVLAAIGRTLRSAIRRDDAVARYGGEEFAVLLPCTTLEQAANVAEKVRESVGRVVVSHGGHRVAVSASAGLATIKAQETVESLIQRADAALYAAKAAGRNCSFVHDGADHRSLADFLSQQKGAAPSLATMLTEMIESPAELEKLAQESSAPAHEFGSYLPREEISTELARTCEELRRFVEEREGCLPMAAPPPT